MPALCLLCVGCEPGGAPPAGEAPPAAPLVVVTSVDADALGPLLDEFTRQTGIVVRLVHGEPAAVDAGTEHDDGMPQADLVIADKVAQLWRAAERNLFRPTRSPQLDASVAAGLRDPERRWTALATETRGIVYRTDRLDDAGLADLADYRSLTAARWRGRLCLASSATDGNRMLVAMLIARHGVRGAELAVRGWRANLGAGIRDDDAQLLASLERGECDLGIAGSAALARHRAGQARSRLALHAFPQRETAMPDAIGAGVARHAANPGDAHALLEWLLTAPANAAFAARTGRSPVTGNAAAAAGPQGRSPGLAAPAYFLEDADRLAERARYP